MSDKLRIARRLDELGVAFIEGGWPGSNPKDVEFFERAAEMEWQQRAHRRLWLHLRGQQAARKTTPTSRRCSTRRPPVCTVVGKTLDCCTSPRCCGPPWTKICA